MTISTTPTASEINLELGRAATAPFNINGAEERALAEVPTGPISFADFIGKSAETLVTILDATMTAGAGGGGRTGYYDGFQAFGPFGTLVPNTVSGIFFGAKCEGTFHQGGVTQDFSFAMQGDFPVGPRYFERIEVNGITTPSFSYSFDFDSFSSVIIGGETYFAVDLNEAFVVGEDYNIKVLSRYTNSAHNLTVGQVDANTYGF